MARRQAALVATERPDRRGVSTEVFAQDGVLVTEETFITLIEPIRLDTGEELWFQSPHITLFYLLMAKSFRDRAEPMRLDAINKRHTTPDGSLRPYDSEGAFDALEGLAECLGCATNSSTRSVRSRTTLMIQARTADSCEATALRLRKTPLQ